MLLRYRNSTIIEAEAYNWNAMGRNAVFGWKRYVNYVYTLLLWIDCYVNMLY